MAVFEEEFNTTTYAGEALSAAEVLVEHPSSSSKSPEIIEAQKAAEAVAVSLQCIASGKWANSSLHAGFVHSPF